MLRQPPESTPTDTLVTDTTLVLSFVAAGVALYFSLDFEPAALPAAVALFVTASVLWLVRRRPGSALCAAALFCLAIGFGAAVLRAHLVRSDEHTSELQSLMRITYALFCLNKKNDLFV